MKPIKDWTLGEVREECWRRDGICHDDGGVCPFDKFCNHICDNTADRLPDTWDLSDTPDITPDELAVCRLLKAGGGQKVWLTGETPEISIGPFLVNGVLPKLLFPSLRPGDTLDLATMSLDPPQ